MYVCSRYIYGWSMMVNYIYQTSELKYGLMPVGFIGTPI